jgi:hypothetical protein
VVARRERAAPSCARVALDARAYGRSSSSLGGTFLAFPLGVITMRIRYFLGIAFLWGLWGCSSGAVPAKVSL